MRSISQYRAESDPSGCEAANHQVVKLAGDSGTSPLILIFHVGFGDFYHFRQAHFNSRIPRVGHIAMALVNSRFELCDPDIAGHRNGKKQTCAVEKRDETAPCHCFGRNSFVNVEGKSTSWVPLGCR